MTYSILAFDRKTGALAAAAATGSLCVGGWVLRGDIDAGLIASQGTAPSTFWRDDALRLMYAGHKADAAISAVTQADTGRAHRQVIAMDVRGHTAGFTGSDSIPFAHDDPEDGIVVAGNMLTGQPVLTALKAQFLESVGSLEDRLMGALRAAQSAGGDSRGLLSAAMLVLRPDAPPRDLRIDHSADPLTDLAALLANTRQSPYANWLTEVPVQTDRARAPASGTTLGTSRRSGDTT